MIKRKFAGLILLLMMSCLWSLPAQAARSFSNTQSPAAAAADFAMGSTQTLSYTIANTSINNPNYCERIYELRFRLSGTGTVFSSATAAPAGWTRTAFSTTSVTFRATSWANSIDTPATTPGKSCATGQGAFTATTFNLVIMMRTTTADVTETLRDIRSRYTLDTNFGNGVTRSGTVTTNNPGSWAMRGLSITSIQTTDLSGTPVTSIFAGDQFRIVTTVRNVSSATQNGITTSAGFPNTSAPGSKSGTWTPASNPSCSLTSTSPSPLNLAAGASGTITHTCSTSTSDSGTVVYANKVRNSTNSTTSPVAISNALSVSVFVASLSTSSSCSYVNQTYTVTMLLRNNSTCTINSITPTLAPSVAGIVTLVSGPTPASIPPLAPSSTTTIDWVYRITGGTAGQTYQFNGLASGTRSGGAGCTGTATTPQASTATLKRGGFDPSVAPANVNSSSTVQNVEWSITNSGCGAVIRVEITYPAGFSWNGDGYAMYGAANLEAEPTGTNPVVFDISANPIPLGGSGDFSLVLTVPPGITVSTPYSFDIGVTENVTGFSTRAVMLTVDPFGAGGINNALPGPWREEYR